jgi:carbon starvation protein
MQKTRYLFITIVPLLFMCAVTFSAGYLKIFSADPKLGFLSGAESLAREAAGIVDQTKANELARQAAVWQFDAVVAGLFLLLVFLIVVGSANQWRQLIRGTKPVVLRESEFVPVTSVRTLAALG